MYTTIQKFRINANILLMLITIQKSLFINIFAINLFFQLLGQVLSPGRWSPHPSRSFNGDRGPNIFIFQENFHSSLISIHERTCIRAFTIFGVSTKICILLGFFYQFRMLNLFSLILLSNSTMYNCPTTC